MSGGGIAIVRALHLGDMLCAVPALRAFRAGFPDSRITLIGLPWATELMPWLASLVDDLVFFPGYPGIPECQFDAADVTAFLAHMQSRQFDLAVQLHGSGAHINEFTLLLGAHRTAVYRTPEDAVPLEGEGTAVPWPTRGSEIERLLALPYALGCPDVGTELGLVATGDDRAALGEVEEAAGLSFREYACVHAGARFPSRRWPPERFAALADALAERGLAIVLTGTRSEAPITAAVRAAMRADAIDLTGRLGLGALGALVSDAALVACNDTGMSHIAAAFGTPSVVVASGSDVSRWAPLDRERHRVLWYDVACRPCMHLQCPTGHECAAGVDVAAAIAQADDLMEHCHGAR